MRKLLLLLALQVAIVGCYSMYDGSGGSIYPDALTGGCKPIPDSEVGTWGRQGASDAAFRTGMVLYYERNENALERFTRCWRIDSTNSSCFLGAGLYLGDVRKDYAGAVAMLDAGLLRPLHISQMSRLRNDYLRLMSIRSGAARCADIVSAIDSVTRIGSWERRNKYTITLCRERSCDDSGFQCARP